MNASLLPPTAAAIEATLRAALAPTALEVIDESAAHAGHAGANAEGFGTHFRVR
ncbi:MAG: BolA/IbaG family iron-sulfur metabolism protein, partial [Comamonadaceae bacterium]